MLLVCYTEHRMSLSQRRGAENAVRVRLVFVRKKVCFLPSPLIDALITNHDLPDRDWVFLLQQGDPDLAQLADQTRRAVYGDRVFIRGLIEFTNICKNDCLYCGIRRSNAAVTRYRLEDEQILSCCEKGYLLGFRTFVFQGGEDAFWTDDRLCRLVSRVKETYPDCAVTLSVGERSRESYRLLRRAGADRYLLRHETADDGHYHRLHPSEMDPQNRKRCLWDLKELGYQVGAGMMIGSPFQTADNLIADFRFLWKLQPDMIGVGPFIHAPNTPFAGFPDGSVALTLRVLSILRLLFPKALLPATTALGTLSPEGQMDGLRVGANVLMPNLSPPLAKKNYSLYENKLAGGTEEAKNLALLKKRVAAAGYRIVTDVGHAASAESKKNPPAGLQEDRN